MSSQLILKYLLVGFAVLAFACGDDEDTSKGRDLCADVQCGTGTCDPDTGECLSECTTTDDCESGICTDGECVEDWCAGVTCDRGVCAIATGECVNADVCSTETEAVDCLQGYGCYGQRCVTEEEYCAEQTCSRGVCSLAAKGCVDAEICTMDVECLDGNFCDNGTCTQNRCDADMVMCSRGVCEGSTGDCVNASPCTTATECVDNFYCVSGTCEDVDTACAACEGNQICNYDQVTTVACEENPTGCENSLDCLGDRVCDAGACVDAGMCSNDALEPFDQATPSVVTDSASATICSGDEDAFSYDVASAAQMTGTLVSHVQVNQEHVGRGELAVELFDKDGVSVASGVTTNGIARLTAPIGNLDRGVYTLVVKESGALSSAGVDYTVFMKLLDEATVTACQNPLPLAATQTGNTLSGPSLSLTPSCANSGTPAEDLYTFEVVDASVVTLTLTPEQDADLVLGLRTNCEADSTEFSCVNGLATPEQFVGLLNPGRYFVVVQAANTSSGGQYTLTYQTQLPICSAADNTCVDVNVAQICNTTGTGFDMVTCSEGCDPALGRCARAVSDVCYTAVDASSGYSGVIEWDKLTDDFDPGLACVPKNGITDGADAAYFVNVPPMSVLTVDLVSNGYDYMALYLVRDCDQVENTCFNGIDADNGPLIYINDTATVQSFYVIADVESYNLDTAQINIAVAPTICTPGTAMCSGTVLETCNSAGTAYDQKTCAFGCDTTTTACIPPQNDVCGPGAIDVSAGGSFMVDTLDYSNDYDLPSAGCTSYQSAGNDAVFQITGRQVGDVVTASLTSSLDTSLYVLRDCADLNSCIVGDDDIASGESVSFVIDDAAPVYIIVDGYSSSSNGPITLDVVVETPDCNTPGQAVACLDMSTLQYCDERGFLTDYACAGGCLGGVCQTPTGDVCWDPIPAAVGGSYTGTFGADNDLDPGSSCIFMADPNQDGGDTIYSVTLQPGETLIADLTTSASASGLYVLSSCNSNSCEIGVGKSKHLEYYSPTGGSYFLVVDNSNAYETTQFTLNLTSRFGDVCQPGGATCDSAGVLTFCNDDGSNTLGTFQCPNGCDAGYCATPAVPNDTCMDAMAVSSDIQIHGSFGDVVDDFDPGSAGCTGTSMDGPDAVYALNLQPGQVVLASIESFASYNSPAIYFVSDCTDVTTTCLAGDVASSQSLTTGYYSATGGPLFLVVDSEFATSEDYLLDIQFKTSECTPGTEICSGPDTKATCNSFGLYDETDCNFGCANGTCNPAPNDLCTGAIDVGAGGTFTGEISQYANDYDPTSSGCTSFGEVGPDAAYAITPAAGEIVTITLDSPADLAVYAVTDCADMLSCVSGADEEFTNGQESIEFLSTGATYYIIVDAYSATATGTYTLEVSSAASVCTPNTRSCTDGLNIEDCPGPGVATVVYPCDTTCTIGSDTCDTGSSCTNAIPILQSGTINGTYYPWQTNISPSSPLTSCTNDDAIGPENVYAITLAAGQTLTASLTATDTFGQDTSLYLITDCSAVDTSCVAGDDQFYGTGESLTYTSATGGVYYLIVDNYDATINTDPTYQLIVSIS